MTKRWQQYAVQAKPEIKPRLEETRREEKAMSGSFDENNGPIAHQVIKITAKQRQEKPKRRRASAPMERR